MDWLFISLNWYVYLLILGAIFYPLTAKIFNRFTFDLGYPFSKVIAIILLSYSSYILGTLKIAPFNSVTLFSLMGIFAFINFLIQRRAKKVKNVYALASAILIEEALFLGAFVFWAYVRSQEPSIRSLEKFMDFGFMNSILRSEYFPPKDIWYSPLSINYYYFGHLSGALLTKLTNIVPAVSYNLILATILGLGVSQVFSLCTNIVSFFAPKIRKVSQILVGLIGAYLVNLGGNLHTIYLWTRGYPNDNPEPFWKIFSGYNPPAYWYPNATRFIPFTIHEFPSYSYVVADLHGHVFDIPFVLLTFALLFLLYTGKWSWKWTIGIGFMTAIHYMTNAFDGPIYLLLTLILLLITFRLRYQFFLNVIVLIVSFILFSLPFSLFFAPFVGGIGVNCAPSFLVEMGKLGPFIFEKGNCQSSPLWMMGILWGFFWISFALFWILRRLDRRVNKNPLMARLNSFIFAIFSFGTLLIIIPEFFYIKDIYPDHYRANTMFKLGYQAFMMMGITSTLTIYLIKHHVKIHWIKVSMAVVWGASAFLVAIYPFYSVPGYYGLLDRQPNLNGATWLTVDYPEDHEIIGYINSKIGGQPTILEAQGDSYSDYDRISAFTGLPTVAGWWVHEWLWRGSYDVVGKRIPDIVSIYESDSREETRSLIKKYGIQYVIVSRLERQKYPNIKEEKFNEIGKVLFRSSNGFGALYQVNP